MKRKVFDQCLFDRYDQAAVDAVIQELDQVGILARRNDDKYGPDIVVWQGFRPVSYLEVEVRSGWKKGHWPERWNPVHIEERKLKYFELEFPCELWILNVSLKNALIVPDYVVNSSKDQELREIPNALVPSGEKFLTVNTEECIMKELL